MKYLKGPFSFILLLGFLSVTLYSQNFKIGFFSGDWARPGLDISNLPQTTGANIIIHQLTTTNFSQFNNFSYMIPQNVWSAAEKINHYTAGMKTKWEAEAPVSNGIGFEHECGTSGGSYWYSGTNSSDIGKYLIKGPHYTQFKKYFLDYMQGVFVNYRLRIKIKRGTNTLPPIQGGSTTDLCKISVLTQGNVVQERTLSMNDITENFTEILAMTYNFETYGGQATYENTIGPANVTTIKEKVDNVEFRVKWLGNRDLYIDYINVNDRDIWDNYNTADLDAFLNTYSSLNQNRLAWYGFDEPLIDNYEPLNVVNQYLINVGNTPVLTTYMPWNGTIYTSSGIQRYITSAQPSTLMFDVYPIRAGVIANQSEGYENALLHQYENLREVCTYANSVYPNNWYFVGQGFGDYSTNPRLPTPAEFNGHSMLAIAHGTRGLIYYKYYGGIDQGLTTTFLSLANRLKSTLGNKLLELSYSGNSIRLHWGTYEGTVSTVTQQYLTLTRPDVYPTYGSFHSSFLDYSPDLNAKYFMLVNELTMTGHAQNINVTVNRPNQNFNNWCWKNIEGGFEETVTDATTKSFTIPLGEGYLYQLAPVVKYGGKIKTNETISGTNTLLGEMTVESGATLTINGTYNINQNITVNSGGSLVINPGATITFSAGKKLKIYGGGSLTANGATFQGNGTPGYWNSISFYANSSGSIQSSTIKDAQAGIYTTTNANVTVSGCTITNNSLCGLSVLQNSNVTVSNCTVSNNGTGINTNSSIITITGNDILNNINYGINANNISNSFYWHDNTLQGNGYAILLNNASPYIHNNFISDNAHGIVITSSAPNFANPSNQWRGYNAITCASTPLFKAENYSTVYMGYGYDGGFNSIFGSDLPDMQSLNHSGIYADNNYWGSPNPQIYADGTSWILARTPLGSDPNPGSECGGYLASSSLVTNSTSVEGDISTNYWEAISQGRRGNFQSAKELLQLIIEGKFDQKYSPLALLTLYEFSVNDKIELNSMLMEIYNRAKDDLLRPFAIRLLAREAALTNNNKDMVFYNTDLINNYPNSVNEPTALYDLVVYYSEIEQDVEKAKGFFSRLKEAYPKEDLTLFAEINLGVMTKGDLKKETSDDKIPNIYYLSAAFPNPFNPTTKISYQMPNESKVILKVYDLIGREVATLVNEVKQAGKYEVQFDASNLSSGVYLYKIVIGDFVKTMKMVVMK